MKINSRFDMVMEMDGYPPHIEEQKDLYYIAHQIQVILDKLWGLPFVDPELIRIHITKSKINPEECKRCAATAYATSDSMKQCADHREKK